ncbi:MAG: hypothetical protein ACREBB_07555 [Nitrosotalea sp.]
MTLEERIKLLRQDLESLNQLLIKTEAEYNTFETFFEQLMNNINIKDEHLSPMVMQMMKEGSSKELDLLRLKKDMIRKISSSTADYLDRLINEYEKSIRDIMVYQDNFNTKGMDEATKAKFVQAIVAVATKHGDLHDIIDACRNCIKDTLKRLES